MSQRILVTGGAGYIGSVLCETLLKEGHKVTVLDNLSHGMSTLMHLCANKDFDFMRGDVRDQATVSAALKNADVIIPLAALVGAPACKKDPIYATTVNLDAIRMMGKLRSKDQRVVYPTTNSGYGTKSGVEFCTEETPLEPISLYGQTKVDAENEILSWQNTITLRLATVFGVSLRMRIDLLVNFFVYAAVTDGYIVIFEKHFKRNFVHIRDVADCFLFCMRGPSQLTGKASNCGLDDANLSKEELALLIKQKIPQFYIHFSEIGQDPDKRNYIVSNKRLADAGFKAKRTLNDGIEELLKAYRMIGTSTLKNI